MRDIKTHSLILSALVSLFLHGVVAALLIPSFLKVFPKQPVSFEVAWLMPSPPYQSPDSPWHPRAGEDPGEALQKTKPVLVRTVPSTLKKAQSPSPKLLDPRLRGDDKCAKGALTEQKFSRPCNDDIQQTQPHQPLPSYPWVCRKRRQEGVVYLYVKTNKEGHVIEASLHKSSGHALLDKAALEAVKAWRFKERNFQKTLSIAFRLKEEKVSFS